MYRIKYKILFEITKEWKDSWDCGACREHVEFAKKHNMLVLVDEDGDIQGVTFNHVMGRNVKDIQEVKHDKERCTKT